MRALIFFTALSTATLVHASTLSYTKIDEPSLVLTFDESTRTAAVTDTATGKVLVDGSTFLYDDPDTIRIDPEASAPCPPIGVTFGVDLGHPGERRAHVAVHAKGGVSNPLCRMTDIEGTYAHTP